MEKPAIITSRATASDQTRGSSARNSERMDTGETTASVTHQSASAADFWRHAPGRGGFGKLCGVIVELKKEYRFEAAHHLPRVPAGHKCARVHGHSYKIVVHVKGRVDEQTGWLVDFGVLDEVFAAEVYARLDHRNLNEVPGLENSTCEVLARFIWTAIRARIPQLSGITVWETTDACCTYRGDE
jgi:6-pyruvoyltetrahydropterin/6-carboxytetrahydropterin synthase